MVSGQLGIFSRSNLSRLVTSMWEHRTLAKWVKAYVEPLPHFKRIQEVSLPDFIICSKDRETKPAETGNWFWESLAITIKLRNVNDKIAAPPQTNMSCRTNMSEQFHKVTLCNIINFCLISFLHIVWLSLPSFFSCCNIWMFFDCLKWIFLQFNIFLLAGGLLLTMEFGLTAWQSEDASGVLVNMWCL